jgi:hypothetical protein
MRKLGRPNRTPTFVAGKGADRHEAASAKRNLPAITDQDIQPQRRHGINQQRQQHGFRPVIVDQQGDGEYGDGEEQHDDPAILADREDLLVGVVACLELAGLTVKHCVRPSR